MILALPTSMPFAFVSSQGRHEISQCELRDNIVLVGAILIAQEMINAV